jgi:hypothetical protein
MKKTASKNTRTLAALIVTLPLTFAPLAVAQSDVSGKLTDITRNGTVRSGRSPASRGCNPVEASKFSGKAPSTADAANAANLAALFVGTCSHAQINMNDHSDPSNTGSKTADVQATPEVVIPVIRSECIGARINYSPALWGIQSSDDPTIKCSGPEADPAKTLGRNIGTSFQSEPFNGMEASSAISGNTFEHIALRNNSIVKATLTDVTVVTNPIRHGESTSNDVRIGGIVIK